MREYFTCISKCSNKHGGEKWEKAMEEIIAFLKMHERKYILQLNFFSVNCKYYSSKGKRFTGISRYSNKHGKEKWKNQLRGEIFLKKHEKCSRYYNMEMHVERECYVLENDLLIIATLFQIVC
jgi:hypothetical protein